MLEAVFEKLLKSAIFGQKGLGRFFANSNVVSHELDDEQGLVKDEYDPQDAHCHECPLDQASSCPEVKELHTLFGE